MEAEAKINSSNVEASFPVSHFLSKENIGMANANALRGDDYFDVAPASCSRAYPTVTGQRTYRSWQ